MSVEYAPAPEVEDIAQKVIAKHHPHLIEETIQYVFRDEHTKDKGKPVAGKARKISGLNAYLSDSDEDYFVIEIARDIWDGMPTKARVALVDHELAHCGITFDEDGNRRAIILPHDLEEFADIVERHGLWSRDLELFIERAKPQLSMLDDNVHHLPTKVGELVDAMVPEGTTVTLSTDTTSVTLGRDESGTVRKVDPETGEIADEAATN